MASEMGQISLDDILITQELSRRTSRTPDLKAENDAFRTLARQLVEQPRTMLQTLAAIAKDLCQAGTAGVSLLEVTQSSEEFRCVAIAGELAGSQQRTAPRQFSPCGVCLERRTPQLYSYPARYFTYLQSLEPAIIESLVIPLVAADQPLGAIWIVSHDPQRQFDGEDMRVMTSLADFTAAALYNNQTRQAAESAQSLLHMLLEHVPEGITIAGKPPDFPIVANSRIAQELLGQPSELSSSDRIQSHGLFLADGATRPTLEQIPLYRATRYGETVSNEEWVIERPDGSRITALVQAVPVRDSQGQIISAINCWQDITESKQAEKALRESEERLRVAQLAAKAGTWDWDIATGSVFWSEEYYILYGLDPATPSTYENWLATILESDREQADRAVRRALKQRQSTLYFEFRIRHPVEEVKWLASCSHIFYNSDGQPQRAVGISIDITDRKQTAAALSQNEARLRGFVDANVVGILYGDIYGNIHEANDELLRIVGYTREDLKAGRLRWIDITPPEYLPRDEQAIAEARARGACTPYEKEYIRKDGRRVPVLLGYSLVGAAREESVAFILDLSDRKHSAAALRQSETRFRLMVESAKEYAIFTLNLNGIITSWNSGAERLLGYQEAEILGRDGRIIFTPEDNARGKAEQEQQIALAQGQAENERWHLRKDGSRFWGSGLVMPLQTEAGNMQGFIKIMQDRTAQRQAEERFRLLYDTTSDLLATEQPMTLMHNLFNKLAAQLELDYFYNYMVEEKDNHQMLHLSSYAGISEEVAQAIASIEFGQYLCGLVAHARRQIVLDQAQIATHPNAQLICSLGITAYAGQPLIVQGRLLGTLSFASRTRTSFTSEEIDLLQSTCDQMAIALERTNLTASLQQQAEQLRQANRIKDEFLAVLSHELRSPLNPILGWTKLLQSGKLDAAKTAQALATIERNAKLQTELIEDLLDVSRILQGKLSLNIRPVDLAMTVAAAIETVSLAAQAKAIDIKTTLDAQVGEVLGDSSRLQQIVWNLVSNAVKFTPRGGRVTVRLTRVGNQAQITVTDTGKGIDPEFLPYVFDYFRQEDGATTRQFGGLGLGLAIVRHLVELHGGTVAVDSRGEGQGATFTVKLPLSEKKEQENPEQRLTSPPTTNRPLLGIRVLVIDDEPDMRDVIAFSLEQSGAEVMTVATATEALAALAQFQPDILLSDIGMPGMDGYMLLRQVRALSPEQGGQVLAIAFTAYATEVEQQQALQAGFQEHLAKPIEPDILVKEIVKLLSNRQRT